MKKVAVLVLALPALAAASTARAGHEAPLYPSYYPQEIRIETVAPDAAGPLLETAKLHAYVGGEPVFGAAPSPTVRTVESLGAFIVIRVNPAAAKNDATACAVAAAVVRELARDPKGFIPHPYPVTAYHGDFLHHADLAEATRARFLDGSSGVSAGLRIRAKGALAERLVRERWPGDGADWSASLEVVDIDTLVAADRIQINGWLGPPWLKRGWFHAYRLLAPALGDPAARARAAALVAQLESGGPGGATADIDRERDLVRLLTGGCRAVVAGYTLKREYYSAQYSDGVENIAHDSHAGLNAAIFLRTVKLKDFPWNGWLRLGVPSSPTAAWNPWGGFDDAAGRLIWSAIGDPALFPEPMGAGWMLNRIGEAQAGDGK